MLVGRRVIGTVLTVDVSRRLVLVRIDLVLVVVVEDHGAGDRALRVLDAQPVLHMIDGRHRALNRQQAEDRHAERGEQSSEAVESVEGQGAAFRVDEP